MARLNEPMLYDKIQGSYILEKDWEIKLHYLGKVWFLLMGLEWEVVEKKVMDGKKEILSIFNSIQHWILPLEIDWLGIGVIVFLFNSGRKIILGTWALSLEALSWWTQRPQTLEDWTVRESSKGLLLEIISERKRISINSNVYDGRVIKEMPYPIVGTQGIIFQSNMGHLLKVM